MIRTCISTTTHDCTDLLTGHIENLPFYVVTCPPPTCITTYRIIYSIQLKHTPFMDNITMSYNNYFTIILIYIHTLSAALPQITGQSGLVTILENSPTPTVLSYTTTGIPPPHSYQWLRNRLPFQGNNRVRVTVGHSSSLEVRSPSRDDSGSYTLVATSLAGRGTLTVELQIACKYLQ